MSTIKFGTDGWRAVIARDFTFANCRLVAQGIAGYVNSANLAKKALLSVMITALCPRILPGSVPGCC